MTMILVGWASLRMVILWSGSGPLPVALRVPPAGAASIKRSWSDPPRRTIALAPPLVETGRTMGVISKAAIIAREDAPSGAGPIRLAAIEARTPPAPLLVEDRVARAWTGLVRAPLSDPVRDMLSSRATPILAGDRPQPVERSDRWAGSAWLFLHGNGAPALGRQSQIGGSQAGARISYALDAPAGLSAVVRATAPIAARGAEVSGGIEWRPGHAPVRLVADVRVPVDHARIDPEIGIVGGEGPEPVGHGLTIESYGEAGTVFRERAEPYADGAARIAHPVATIAGKPVTVGLGIWGAAQREAARADIGPSVGWTLPGPASHLRLSLDWRERIAGHARPGSGLAFTLGADF